MDPMTKEAAVRLALDALPDAPAVCTTGYTARIAALLGRPNHLPMTGSMGLALPVGTGIALASGRLTLVVDGDGSLLMNPGGLVTLGALPRVPVIHLVLDDGVYASTGGQPTPGVDVDYCALAAASGIPTVRHVRAAEALRRLLGDVSARRDGPVFVHCPVTADPAPPAPRVADEPARIARRFTAHLREAAGGGPSSAA